MIGWNSLPGSSVLGNQLRCIRTLQSLDKEARELGRGCEFFEGPERYRAVGSILGTEHWVLVFKNCQIDTFSRLLKWSKFISFLCWTCSKKRSFCTNSSICLSVFEDIIFPVESVQVSGGYVVHEVIVSETLKVGDQVHLFVDEVTHVGWECLDLCYALYSSFQVFHINRLWWTEKEWRMLHHSCEN